MNELIHFNTLGFGMIGWQELVILACPLVVVGIVLLVLYLCGMFGGNKDQD